MLFDINTAIGHWPFRQVPHESPSELRALHLAMQDKAFDLMMDRRALDSEIRTLLTPEQRQEWDKLLAYRQGMKRGRKGDGQGF